MSSSNQYMKTYMLRRYHARRKASIQQLGEQCVKCGSKKLLEFHHTDPDSKDFTVARGASFSEERWQREIAKCDLLCHNCHVAHHSPKHRCGDVKKYWQGCRCDKCRAAKAEYHRQYIMRSRGLS